MRTSKLVPTVAAAVALTLAGTVPAATADTTTPSGAQAVGPDGQLGPARQTDISLGGYVVSATDHPAATPLTAGAQFTVPVVTCGATGPLPVFFALYLNGYDPAGDAPSSSLTVRVDCRKGMPTYTTHVYETGDPTRGAAGVTAPGHVVRFAVRTTATATSATVSDLTAGTSTSATGTPYTVLDSVQVSAQLGDGRKGPYPHFAKVTFTAASFEGEPLGSWNGRFVAQAEPSTPYRLQPGPFRAGGTTFPVSVVAQ